MVEGQIRPTTTTTTTTYYMYFSMTGSCWPWGIKRRNRSGWIKGRHISKSYGFGIYSNTFGCVLEIFFVYELKFYKLTVCFLQGVSGVPGGMGPLGPPVGYTMLA